MNHELIEIARAIEALKQECGIDPESPRAIQNSRYMTIANRVRALATATLAAGSQAVQVPGWRPIDSAPRDGTHILVSWPMREMDEDDAPTGPITRRDTLVTWMNGNCWIEPDYLGASGAWYGDDDCYAADPDFWMPLPAAPLQPLAGGEAQG